MTDKQQIDTKLIQVFGEENVDINEKGGVLIRFEDIDITNIEGSEHNIKGLYVQLKWVYDEEGNIKTFGNYLYGMRNIYTEAEIYSHYMHSHLTGFYPDEEDGGEDEDGNEIINNLYIAAQDFCLGSDSLSQLLGGLNLGFDIDQFQILLNTIDEFVRWESLEGGPYILIQDIATSSNQIVEVTRDDSCSYTPHITEKVYKELTPEDIALVDYIHAKAEKVTILKDSEEFFNRIETILSTMMLKEHNIIQTRKYEDKYYVSSAGRRGISEYAQNVGIDFDAFSFKGETQYLEILPTEEEDNNYKEIMANGVLTAHPYATSTIIRSIEDDLNNFITNNIEEWKLVK